MRCGSFHGTLLDAILVAPGVNACFKFPGVAAEQVARNAVEELQEALENNCCVDQHLQDQV